MRLIILGSGNADHHAGRASAGFLLETPAGPILLDFGPGCWRNLARAGVAPGTIRAIFLSHLHADHWADLVAFLFHQSWHPVGRPRPPLSIFGPPETGRVLERLRRIVPHLGAHSFPLEIRDVRDGEVELEGVRAVARPVPHVRDLDSVAWRIESPAGGNVAYSGDCYADARVVRALEGADLAVVEATFPSDRPHPVHLTARDAGALARQAGVQRLVLAHLSLAWNDRDPAAEASETFQGPVFAGTDLMALDVRGMES